MNRSAGATGVLAMLTVAGASVLVFALLNFLPGDITDVLAEETFLTESQRLRLRTELGLDDPVHVRYVLWLRDLAKLDFGHSLFSGEPVRDMLQRTVPRTLNLSLFALAIGSTIGLTAGVLAAVHQNSPIDHLVRNTAALFVAIPSFWSGTVIIIVLVTQTGWAPPPTYTPITDDPMANLRQLFLPALIIGLTEAAILAKIVRSAMLQQLEEDYVRTARAKGLFPRVITIRHVFRNAALPVVTMLSLLFSNLLTGSVVMEQVFNIPGMGSLLLRSVVSRDYPVVMAIVMLVVVFVITLNLITDYSYRFLDPRVRGRS